MAGLVSLRLLRPVLRPSGGQWNAGETAGFPAEEAAILLAQGAAVRPVPRAPTGPPQDKAPVAPARDKMLRRSGTKAVNP